MVEITIKEDNDDKIIKTDDAVCISISASCLWWRKFWGSSRGGSNPDAVAAGYQAYLQGGLVIPQSKQAAGAAVVVASDLTSVFQTPESHVDSVEQLITPAKYEQIYNCMAEKYPEFVSGATPYVRLGEVNDDFTSCAFHSGVYTTLDLLYERLSSFVRGRLTPEMREFFAQHSLMDLVVLAEAYKNNHYDDDTRAFLDLGDRDDSLDFLADVEIKSSDVKALLELNNKPYNYYQRGFDFFDPHISYLFSFGLSALPIGADPLYGINDQHAPQETGLNTRDLVVGALKDLLKKDTTTAGNIAKAINNTAGNQGGYYKMRVSHPTKKGADGLDMSINVALKPEFMLYGENQLLPYIVKSVCAKTDADGIIQKQRLLALAPTLCMSNQERLLNFVNSILLKFEYRQAPNGKVTADLLGFTRANKELRTQFLQDFKHRSTTAIGPQLINLKFDTDPDTTISTIPRDRDVNYRLSFRHCPRLDGMESLGSEDYDAYALFSVNEIRTDIKKRRVVPPPFPSENYGCVDGEDRAAFYQCLHEKMVESLVGMKTVDDLKEDTIAVKMMFDWCTYAPLAK